MRSHFTLRCTVCKSENYRAHKNKKIHSERLETKKYCPKCKTHTLHKEKK
jgi:large subunit ribosomal protein L33